MNIDFEEFGNIYMNRNYSVAASAVYFGCSAATIQRFASKNNIRKTPEQKKEIYLKSMQDKYGVNNPSQLKSIQEQKRNNKNYPTKKFLCDKYIIENLMVRDIADLTGFSFHIIKKLLKEHGFKKTKSQHQENKLRGVCEKYGVDNIFQAAEIKEKSRQTMLNNYGVEHPAQSPEIMEKIKTTCKKNWGTSHHFQSDKYWKANKHYKCKDYIMPSGNTIKIQGNEGKALDILLETYDENQIITNDFEMPYIWYEFKGKRKRYFPDIYIPDENIMIEVKSKYTYEKSLEQNLLKRDATIAAGFHHEFMVID